MAHVPSRIAHSGTSLRPISGRLSVLRWLTASAKLTYSNIRYQGISPSTGIVPTDRKDNYLNLDVRFDYPFKDYLIGSLGYVLQYNNTNAQLNATVPGGVMQFIPLDYIKHEVWLRLSFLY